jgi:hypothetical protein
MEKKMIEKKQPGLKSKRILSNPMIIASAIIIIVFLFFFISSKFLSLTQKENMEYSDIDRTSYFNGKVIKVYEDKGFTFITLLDSLKIWLPHSRNYNYDYPYLNGFVLIGDSIEKKSNNDTLKIFRKSDQYYFILGKFINQSKPSHSKE